MKVRISQTQTFEKHVYRADMVDLPGTPPIGIGDTPEMAVLSLFHYMLHPSQQTNWLRYIKDWDNVEIKRDET